MNERIRELAEQANGVFIHKLMTGAKQYTFLEDDLEKFAELIIKECAEVAKETRWFVPPSQEQIARGIKQHFGVRE